MDRTIGCGPITAEKALQYSFSGPNLRAAGVDYDVRAMNPYSSYEEFEFQVPVGTHGDTYDRYMVRDEEMWQSLSIIRQAIEKLKNWKTKHLSMRIFHLSIYLQKKMCTTTWRR